jgi:hypothetical protein
MTEDAVRFVREVAFPGVDCSVQVRIIDALLRGKRVCVWPRTDPLEPVVCIGGPPRLLDEDSFEYHQPAGEYEDLLIIDLPEVAA